MGKVETDLARQRRQEEADLARERDALLSRANREVVRRAALEPQLETGRQVYAKAVMGGEVGTPIPKGELQSVIFDKEKANALRYYLAEQQRSLKEELQASLKAERELVRRSLSEGWSQLYEAPESERFRRGELQWQIAGLQKSREALGKASRAPTAKLGQALAEVYGPSIAGTVSTEHGLALEGLSNKTARLKGEMDKLRGENKQNTEQFHRLSVEAQKTAAEFDAVTKASDRFVTRQRKGLVREADFLAERRALVGPTYAGELSEAEVAQARLRHGEQVVTRAGGPASIAKSGRAITSREDMVYAEEYLKSRERTARAEIDVMRAQSDGSRDSQKQLTEATKKAQQYRDAIHGIRNAQYGYNEALRQAGGLLTMFFRYAVGYMALYQVLGAITGLVRGIFDLDAALTSIKAVTQATDAEMRTIEGSIKRVAVTTKFTAGEIAKAAQVLGQAGVAAKDFPTALAAVAAFASATESSLETSADLFTTMRDVFSGLEDLDIANQLTRAVNISKLTADDLKTVLSLSSSIAHDYNLTSQQYLAAVTTLRNAGLKASTTATGLRQVLLETFSPDTKALKALSTRYQQIGESITKEQISARFFGFSQTDNPLVSVLGELRRLGYGGAGESVFQRAFDVRTENALKALIGRFDELQAAEARIDFGQAAAEGAATQMEATTNALKNLGAAFSVAAHDIGKDWLPAITEAIQQLTGLVEKAREANYALTRKAGSGLGSALGYGLEAGAIAFGTAPAGTNTLVRIGKSVAAFGAGTYAATQAKETVAGAAGQDSGTWQSIGQLIASAFVGVVLGRLGSLFSGLKSGVGALASRTLGRRAATEVTGETVAAGMSSAGRAAAGTAGSTVTTGALVGGAVAISGGFLKKAASKLLTALGFGTGGVGILGAIVLQAIAEYLGVFDWIGEQIFGKQSEDKRKINAALKELDQAARARQDELDKYLENVKQVELLRPSSGQYQAKSGSIAGALEAQIEAYDDLTSKLQETFAGATDTQIGEARAILLDLSKHDYQAGTYGFEQGVKALQEAVGDTGATLLSNQRQLSDLAQEVGRTNNESVGFFDELIKRYNALRKQDVTKLSTANRTLLKVVENASFVDADIYQQIEEEVPLTADQMNRFSRYILTNLKKIGDADWNAIKAQDTATLDARIRDTADSIVRAFEAAGKNIEAIGDAHEQLIDLIRKHGQEGADVLLRKIAEQRYRLSSQGGLEKRLKEAEAEFQAADAALKSKQAVGFGGGVFDLTRRRRDQAKEALDAARAEAEQARAAREVLIGQFTSAQNAEERAREAQRTKAYEEARTVVNQVATSFKNEPDLTRKLQEERARNGGAGSPFSQRVDQTLNLVPVVDKITSLTYDLSDAEREVRTASLALDKAATAAKAAAGTPGAVEAEKARADAEQRVQAAETRRFEVKQELRNRQSQFITTTQDDRGRTKVSVLPSIERTGRAVELATTAIRTSKERAADTYVEGPLERASRDRIHELEVATETLKDQRRFSELLGVSEEKYSLQIDLAKKELEYQKTQVAKALKSGTDAQIQTEQNKLRSQQEAVSKLEVARARQAYDIRKESVSAEQKVLEERLTTLKKLTADMVGNPLFADWGKFSSLNEQYLAVQARLIELIKAAGEMYNKTPEEVQNQIDALKASGASLYEFTDAFDKATKAAEAYLASFETLYSPKFIGKGTDLSLAKYRRENNIQEPAGARAELIRQQSEAMNTEFKRLIGIQEIQFKQISAAKAEGRDTSALSLSLTETQKAIQDLNGQMASLSELAHRVGLDINAELAQGFNVEGIMSDLRQTVEETIGSLGDTIRQGFSDAFGSLSDTIISWAYGDLEGSLWSNLNKTSNEITKRITSAILKAVLEKSAYSLLEKIVPGSSKDLLGVNKKQGGFSKLLSENLKDINAMTVNAKTVIVNGLDTGPVGTRPAADPVPRRGGW